MPANSALMKILVHVPDPLNVGMFKTFEAPVGDGIPDEHRGVRCLYCKRWYTRNYCDCPSCGAPQPPPEEEKPKTPPPMPKPNVTTEWR